MKRLLLLLFVLCPVILFGQTRREKVIDSIKAATVTNSQRIFTILGNKPGTKVEQTDVLDSGEYVTIVTRIHIPKTEYYTALHPRRIAKLKIRNIVARSGKILTLPPIPPVVRIPDSILALSPIAVFKLNTHIPVVKVGMVTLLPIPDIMPAPEALPFLAVAKFAIKAIPVKADTLTVPPLPDLVRETDDLPLLAAVKFAVEDTPARKINPVAVPYYEIKEIPVSEMHLSTDGYSLLEKMEGFSPGLYSLKDGGFTIGFGFFLPYADGDKWDKGVTWGQAETMIRQKVPAYEDQVKRYINVPLTQNEFDALTMLAYNLGGFSKATSIVNDVNSQAGYDKLQSDWSRFIHSKAPGVAKGLMNRRRDELGVRREADYQPERKIQILTYKK